jgi:predicted chitinase
VGEDSTFEQISAITRKDSGKILPRDVTYPFTDKTGVTYFQIRPHTWMHQDDVEQLSQHDLTTLNFHTIEAAPTTDFSRSLDENWVTEAVKSIGSHFDSEKGPDSSETGRFYNDLLRDIRIRDAQKPKYPDNALNQRLFTGLHTQGMGIAEFARRLVVKHDSDWHSTAQDPRWSGIMNDREESPAVRMSNSGFLDVTHWMDKVPPFANHKSVWHFHPLEFLEILKPAGGKITLPMLRKIWTDTRRVSDEVLQQIADELSDNLERCHLNTEARLYHFMAQVYQETGANFSITENLNYAPTALPVYFSYYRHHPDEQELDGRTASHPANQENIANKAYGKRNGNNLPGDGWRYIGRGMKQLTGRDNYRKFTEYSFLTWGETINFEEQPDLVSNDIQYAVRSALFFWDDKNMYFQADGGYSLEASVAVTNIINSGLSMDDKKVRYGNLEDLLHKQIFQDVFG